MLIENYFDEVAEGYLAKSNKGLWAVLRNREQKSVMQAVDPFPGMTCLELGCGAGFYTKPLKNWATSLLLVVDFSQNMLKQLNIPDLKKVRADIQNIKFRRSFDRVVCAGALEFLPNHDLFFANLKNYLSQDGKAVLLIPRKGLWGYAYKLFHYFHGIKIRLYGQNELINILARFDLKIQDISSPTPMNYVLSIKHDGAKKI